MNRYTSDCVFLALSVLFASASYAELPQIGACCLGDGSCTQITANECADLGGEYLGDGVLCGPMGSCCVGDDLVGPCEELAEACCDAVGGRFTPGGNCYPMGACCYGGDFVPVPIACTDTSDDCCTGLLNQWLVPMAVCEPPIACCLGGFPGSCSDMSPTCCESLSGGPSPYADACMGDANGNNVDDACEQPGQACCLEDGSCVDTSYDDCVARGGDPRGPGTGCTTTPCAPLKWVQPPTRNPVSPTPECFWGWDEPSMYPGPQIVADDWLCDTAYPVTDVHWWGSYVGWDGQDPPAIAPDSFHIGIWTDVPAGVEPFSHPGTLIWERVISRDIINERPVGCDCYPGMPCDTCFRYDYNFSFVDPFFQKPACTVYWVSISAVYGDVVDPPNPWGWKTREHFFSDDAVVIWSPTEPTVGSDYLSGGPIENPAGVSWDMAFTLTTSVEELEACCMPGPDYTCLDLTRLVCLHFGGVPQGAGTGCVDMTIACCLPDGGCADVDPLCCDDLGGFESPWASACMGDANGNNIDDACEQPMGVCCLPDSTCIITTEEDCAAMGGVYAGDGSQCSGPQACCLPDATCIDTDAVCCAVEHGGYPLGPDSDCATGANACRRVKWSQPPNVSRTGVDVRLGPDAGSTRIIADDFVCTALELITDVHLWGSWKDDVVGQITQIHVSIHDNDPVGPGGLDPSNLFPQPDVVLWSRDFFSGEFTETPFAQVDPGEWWWDPVTGELIQAGDSQVWQIDIDIDPHEAFRQEGSTGDPVTYWLSARIATAGGEFGWKTRHWPYPLNTDAVWDMGSELPRIWKQLRYPPGHPYHGLERDSMDMAFALTTHCPAPDPPTQPSGEPGYEKNRYISFVPDNDGREVALRVTLAEMPLGFDPYEGCQLWVGEPEEISESSGDSGSTVPPTFTAARLQTEPHCMDWGQIEVLHVSDDEIVAGALYEVEAIDCLCDPADETTYSDPLSISTSRWGDVVGEYDGSHWTASDADADFDDITSLVDKFRNVPTAPIKARADIAPDLTDRIVDFIDIPWMVDAFRGLPYPFDGPDDCPTPLPYVSDYSNGGCKDTTESPVSGVATVCPAEEVELTVGPGTLHVVHRDATYNCCIGDIVVTLASEGNVLRLTEQGVGGEPCDCLCCYDVESTVIGLQPGAYTVEYCWPGPGSCHVENIVIPPPPRLGGYMNTGCLDKSGADVGPCEADDEIVFTARPGVIDVLHRDATYNCCLDDIAISLSVDGNVLRLREEEVLTNPCYCVCCYGVSATIVDVAPGSYTVEFCWQDFEAGGERCYTEVIEVP